MLSKAITKTISKPRLQDRWGLPRLRDVLINTRYQIGLQGSLPRFLIIGAQKSGTSSLYKYMAQHPQIVPSLKKECHFFNKSHRYHRGDSYYRAHFLKTANPRRQITGEASPAYLMHPQTPSRVKAMLPHAKFIVLMRDPIARAFSHYQHMVRNHIETLSFEEALKQEQSRIGKSYANLYSDPEADRLSIWRFSYLTRSRYAHQIENWRMYHPASSFLYLSSEAFFADPQQVLGRVFEFLDLDHFALPNHAIHAFNAGAYKNEIDPASFRFLKEVLAPEMPILSTLCGQSFGWETAWT